jgi:predicted aldo/keto reductase-like oxidoreductase
MHPFFTFRHSLPPVRRLGLATRGNTRLTRDDVWLALQAGINYWNWCGHEDGVAAAARELGSRRNDVVIAVPMESRDKESAQRELEENLDRLKTDYIDVVTFYYVEHREEWQEIIGARGTLPAMQAAQEQGLVRLIGLTTHQRSLGAEVLKSRKLDLLMARYNAAHRSAETAVFPIAQEFETPVVTFTSLRWKGLLHATPEDPPHFKLPSAPDWYRLVLSNPAVAVALMAPDNRKELQDNLTLLADWRPPTEQEREALFQHGERVRRHAGRFP